MAVTSFNTCKRDRYLGALRQGLRRGEATKRAGVCRQTIAAYLKEHPEFQQEINQAEADACDVIEDALWQKAKEGNVTAMQVWLYNRSGGRWQDRRNIVPVAPAPTGDLATVQAELIKRLQELHSPETPT